MRCSQDIQDSVRWGCKPAFHHGHQSPSLTSDTQTHTGPCSLTCRPPAEVAQVPETRTEATTPRQLSLRSGWLSAETHSVRSLCWKGGTHPPVPPDLGALVRARSEHLWDANGQSSQSSGLVPRGQTLSPCQVASRNGAEDSKPAATPPRAGDLHSLREGPPWKQRGPNSAPWGVQAIAGVRGRASQGPLNTHPGFRDHMVNSIETLDTHSQGPWGTV